MKIYLFLITFLCATAYAQTDRVYLTNGALTAASDTNTVYSGTIPPWYKNLEKYWYYRYRLINDFMLIGVGAGKSIPAQKRKITQSQKITTP